MNRTAIVICAFLWVLGGVFAVQICSPDNPAFGYAVYGVVSIWATLLGWVALRTSDKAFAHERTTRVAR